MVGVIYKYSDPESDCDFESGVWTGYHSLHVHEDGATLAKAQVRADAIENDPTELSESLERMARMLRIEADDGGNDR